MVTGVIEATAYPNKFGKNAILINGNWYNSQYPIRADQGDEVEFDSGSTGKYVNRIKVLTKGGGASTGGGAATTRAAPKPGFPVAVDTKDRSIVRQNSLSHAVNLVTSMSNGEFEFASWDARVSSTETFAKLCVDIARIFEDYSAGDSDAAEARAMMEE